MNRTSIFLFEMLLSKKVRAFLLYYCLIFHFSNIYYSQSSLDPAFGINGIKTFTLSSKPPQSTGLAVTQDEKAFITGFYVDPTNTYELGCVVCIKQNGGIDSTWGNNGSVVIPYCRISNIAIQNDGKIVLTAWPDVFGNGYFDVKRLLPDGTTDINFGANGTVTTSITNGSQSSRNVIIQPDGKILVSGESASPNVIVVVRYNSDGSLDNTFGVNGSFTTALSINNLSYLQNNDAQLQTDGKILLVCQYQDANGVASAIARLNPDATFDNSFGNNGIIITPFARAISLSIQTDGKLLCAGTNSCETQIIRYNPNGTADNAYGTISTSQYCPKTTTIQPDNKLLVAGEIQGAVGVGSLVVTRYNTNGTADPSFGNNSQEITDVNSGYDWPVKIRLKPSGKIILAGYSVDIVNSLSYFMLTQYISGLQIGLDERSETPDDFTIFPNPSCNFSLKIDYPQSQSLTYFITDILGREVGRESFKANPGLNTIDINFKGNSGVYVLKVFDDQKLLYTQKLIRSE